MSDRRKLSILISIIIIISLFYLLVGTNQIFSPLEIFRSNFVINTLRMPRLIVAFCIGGLLSISGMLLQRMIGNPIASPDIMGISSGASFGVILVYFWFMNPSTNSLASTQILPVVSFLFSFLIMSVISVILYKRATNYQLVLFGLGISSLFSAAGNFLIATGPIGLPGEVAKYKTGTLSSVNMNQAVATLVMLALIAVVLIVMKKYLVVLMLENDKVESLGINTNVLKFIILLIICIIVSASVVIVGVISFLGIIAPHISRSINLKGPGNQLIACFFVGSILLTIADWLGQNLLYPISIPAGVLIAIIGIPTFITVIYLERRKYGD